MAAQQHTPRPRRVAVFGQGYVGLSVACAAATAGYDVVGIDTDDVRIASLAEGDLAVPGVRDDEFDSAVATRRLSFTTDGARCNDADVVLICVPTPVLERLPDLSMVAAAGRTVAEHMALVPEAAGAVIFCAGIDQLAIEAGRNGARHDIEKARPACAAIKLRVRCEQRQVAPGAMIDPVAFLTLER